MQQAHLIRHRYTLRATGPKSTSSNTQQKLQETPNKRPGARLLPRAKFALVAPVLILHLLQAQRLGVRLAQHTLFAWTPLVNTPRASPGGAPWSPRALP